jgi:hypothetical protein
MLFRDIPPETGIPADAGLCGCILGEYFIHKTDCTDKAVF